MMIENWELCNVDQKLTRYGGICGKVYFSQAPLFSSNDVIVYNNQCFNNV